MGKDKSYAEAMAEIELILARLSEENTGIDTLAEDVKKATELINSCREKLRKTEEEVNKMLSKED